MLISFQQLGGSRSKAVLPIALALASVLVSASQNTPTIDSRAIFERTKAATVVVLAGEGAGRLTAVSTGVIISPANVLLTALHAIKGANEVQIRLPNGEVFDHVELLGVDDRRDVAALRISAGILPGLPVGNTRNLAQGDAVYAVTNSRGLVWSATEGILSSIRSADDIPAIGSGFRLLQFSAPISPGSSGGALVDRWGNLIGIITNGDGSLGFAVPIESVIGLAELGQHNLLGSGRSLQMPARAARQIPGSSAEIAAADHKKILDEARTIHIVSSTQFITASTLSRALALQKEWPKLGLTIVNDQRVADISLDVDRVIFTHVHTYSLVDRKTSIVLSSGRVRAFDGILASDGIAEDVVRYFSAGRLLKTGNQ